MIENDKFGWRFFPRAIARSPSPLLVKAAKPPGACRIFLFGESAALGDPKPAYGVGRYLEALLRERFPGKEFEVVCVAMVAVNSQAILPIARDCARHQGDIWIVYMGNNEMEGPFGANFRLGPPWARRPLIRSVLAIRSTKIGQVMENALLALRGHSAAASSWEGMKMFLKERFPPDDPRRQMVYGDFRKNLEAIVRVGLRSGARPIVCTVAANLKDSPPFASVHSQAVSEGDRARWESVFQQGGQLQSAGQFAQAQERFAEAARIDSQFAEVPFREGQCHVELTNYAAARGAFEKARDADALPFRTDGVLNRIIREVAAGFSSQGAQFLDVEAELARQSPGAIPGEELFHDHVHLNFEGNYLFARLLAGRVEKLLPAATTTGALPDWASAEVCDRRLGLTDWNRGPVYETMFQRLSDAPFTNQLDHAFRMRRLLDRIVQTRERLHPRVYLETREIYEEAAAKRPRDFRLAENWAEFLEAVGDLEGAEAQWRRVADLLPHHYAAYFQIGRLLGREKKYAEAKDYLHRALSIRPDLVEARIELGQVLFKEGKPAEALLEYAEARKQRPQDAGVLLQMANALAAQEKRTEALASLREAIRLRPGFWEARYFLGVELAVANRIPEAIEQFREVIHLRPDHAAAHFNLGVGLAKQGQIEGAASEFQETLRLDPNHRSARQYLESLDPSKKTSQ